MSQLPFEQKHRKVFIKHQATTDPKFGCLPTQRSIKQLVDYGIVVIDKPAGPSSHQVGSYVKQILGRSKAGHAGTLDPQVTGVLPVAVGRATRIVQSLLPAGKEYVAIMHVHQPVTQEKISKACQSFVGNIQQLPPVKSAVKRQLRQRSIYYLNILDIRDQDVLFIVGVQAGTYIRKLIHDIGQTLGVGAHMAELRRTKAGPFDESYLVTLQDVHDAWVLYQQQGREDLLRTCLLPVEAGVRHLAKVWVMDTTVDSICHGSNLKIPGVARYEDFSQGEHMAIMTLKDELVAVGITVIDAATCMKQQKGVLIKLDQVFMLPGTYPRMDRPKEE